MTERADWQRRDTDLVVPLIFTVAGVSLIGLGVGFYAAHDGAGDHFDQSTRAFKDNDSTFGALSIVSFVAGVGTLVTAGILWARRTSEGRQAQELERIDGQLKLYGVHASLSPWIVPPTSLTAGASGGMTLTLKL